DLRSALGALLNGGADTLAVLDEGGVEVARLGFEEIRGAVSPERLSPLAAVGTGLAGTRASGHSLT
ncbi:MAG: hypothetical protein RLZZ387_4398, partial [Chloroflexota bacterium]